MSALTLLSTTKLPPKDESFTSVSLYQMDDDTYWTAYALKGRQYNSKYVCDPEDGSDRVLDNLFWNGISTYEEYIMDLLDLYEEPDYAVLPGGLYHRYTVEIIHDVAIVAETIAYNV